MNMQDSAARVEARREKNLCAQPLRLPYAERIALLRAYHPSSGGLCALQIGANRGDCVPEELARRLQAPSPVQNIPMQPKLEADVLILGGGGAGAAAAIEADSAGTRVILATKFRLGDSNTQMAEGGIQAAEKPNDSPALHFLDTYGGGHFAARRDLVRRLVSDAPETLRWLKMLGVELDAEADGSLRATHGGGTSRRRVHSAGDRTGLELMRVLGDEVRSRSIKILEFSTAIELLSDKAGRCTGAVLQRGKQQTVVRAKTVILCTGGAGDLRFQGFPTSNHCGTTADGLALAYRLGARLRELDAMQYHPTGAAYPPPIRGLLVTERARALGAMLLNAEAEPFIHPLEPRDACTAAILREAAAHGIDGAVWLDTPMIDRLHGAGTLERELPALLRLFGAWGIDPRCKPLLVCPTLHYQNGGIEIAETAETRVENLFAAGETAGGIHGRNRLMGNSLLDILVFGRIAGRNAAQRAKSIPAGELTLCHAANFEAERRAAGLDKALPSSEEGKEG